MGRKRIDRRWKQLDIRVRVVVPILMLLVAAAGAYGTLRNSGTSPAEAGEEASTTTEPWEVEERPGPQFCAITAHPDHFADPPIPETVTTDRSILDTAGAEEINLRARPCTDPDGIVGSVGPGERLEIVCQVRSQRIYDTSSIWDHLSDGTWIADYFVAGTRVNQFTPGIPHC
jgi:hypothetical protein